MTGAQLVLLAVGFVFSLFYGWKAVPIFVDSSVDADAKPWPWKLHQFWFNFLGSLVGWIACTILVGKWRSGRDVDWLLALVAFIGMTGHLPRAAFGIVEALSEFAQRLLGLAKSKSH